MEGDTLGVFGRRPLKEVVTPHKLSLLSLVFEYTQRKSDDGGKGFTQKQMTDFMTCILKLLQSPDVTLQDMLTRLRRILEQTLHEAFSERLKKFYSDGVSAIMDFFELLSQLMGNKTDAGPVITKSSILGIFIRRMILAFEKLSFSQVISLYGQFKVYYESVYAPLSSCEGEETGDLSKSIAELSMSLPSFSALSKANLTKNLEALSLSEGYGKEITGGFYSQKQAEYFISQQVFLLQHNENEALSPPKLQQKILEILKVNPDLAEAHFLSYLNHLRVKEYVTALHSHFHYFDRHTFTSPDDKLKDEDVRLRYAALNLASLHFRFRHRKEAKAALQEAIQLAQENNDHICLQHALGWLYRLGETGNPTTVDLMERSITKTGELNLPYLTSLGVQAFARHNALSTVKPASIFDSLMKSDILNCQHSQSKFMCVSYSQKAALWHMYGKREMSSMASQLALHLNTSDCGIYHSGESDCVALCNLARQHTDQGRYSAAFEMINNAKKQAPPTSQHAHIWMSCEQEMTFTKAVLAGNWHVAEQAIQNLKAVSQQESDIRQALLLKEQGQATPALTLIHKLLRDSPEERALLDKPDLTADYKCRLLLLLAELFCQTGSALAAIPHLLECLTLARSHHLEYLVALAGVLLAYVQYMMQLPSQALSILDEHMMRVLTNGSLYDQAKVLYLYGKCQVAAASKAADGHRKSDLLPVVSMMTTVIDMFSRVEATRRVKDAVYFQARLYHELGYTAERNKCAHRFRLLDKQQATLSAVLVSGV